MVYVLTSPPIISVVTPVHSTNHKLPEIRKALYSAKRPVQLIVVLNNPNLVDQISPQKSSESVVICSRKGRGFAFLKGIERVTGAITVLLHSDTIPALGWDDAILAALRNPQIVGGGFSPTYDTPKPYFNPVTWVVKLWFRISGELYGDGAMFIRSNILRRCRSVLEVPLFEDLRLAQCMHKYGQVVLLDKKVKTSAESFRRQGVVQHIGKILLCRVWYALGGSPFQIYNVYYSTLHH